MMPERRADILRSLPIGPAEFVIEVGGGHAPFWRSDLIVDKYPFDTVHRTEDLFHAAPVIKADATRLPLPEKACDVLFASHMIEHLREPDKFIKEAQRCACRIYLEFPSVNRELMYAWAFHEWLVELKDRVLVFYRNDLPQLFGTFFHRSYDAMFDIWSSHRFADLNSHVFCDSNELSCEFARETALEYVLGHCVTGAAKVNSAVLTPVRYSWGELARLAAHQVAPEHVVRWLVQARSRRRGRPKAITQALVDRLVCLTCGAGGLALAPTEILCHSCHHRYVQRNGIFDFDP
jgi:hypothetical protein